MDIEEFEALVAEECESLRPDIKKKIKNVAFLVEEEPSAEVRTREGLTPEETLLGYYQGIPLTERGENYGVGPTMPDTITLYKHPIEEASEGDTISVRRIVRETIEHEIAHYFGMDEGEVEVWEEKRDAGLDDELGATDDEDDDDGFGEEEEDSF